MNRDLRFVWPAALACFLLAALTGVLYRYGLAFGETFGFSFVNIRHAHSHLMYFGWPTPVLMAIIAAIRIPPERRRAISPIIWTVFAGATASYPLFLLFGYQTMAIGSAELPIAVIASSLNMLAWYAFVVVYAKETRGTARDRAGVLFDLSLLFLVLSSLGAWALALLKPLGIDSDIWASALTHIFLDLFSEGWFVLATLGVIFAVMPRDRDAGGHWSIALVCAGLPVTFAMGMPSALVPAPLASLATLGNLSVGVGLIVLSMILIRRLDSANWLLFVPLAFLFLKATGQVSESLTPAFSITSIPGLRLIYLHAMLLGFVSIALMASARLLVEAPVSKGAVITFTIGATAMIASLIMFTPLIPFDWIGSWTFRAAFWFSLVPIPGVVWLLIDAVRTARRASITTFRP
jgi:hypothetical protein